MREKKKTAIRHYTEGFIFILPRFLYTRKLSLDDGYFSIPFFLNGDDVHWPRVEQVFLSQSTHTV